MISPEHLDFIYDTRLSPEQIGALALMMYGEGPFHSHWLSEARPAGRSGSVGSSKSRRIIRELKALGYIKVEATWRPAEGLTRLLTSVRGSLTLPFVSTGPFVEHEDLAPQEKRAIARAKTAESIVPMGKKTEEAFEFELIGPMGERNWSFPKDPEAVEAKFAPLTEVEEDDAMAELDLAMVGRHPSDFTNHAEIVEAEIVEEVAIISTAKKARKPTIAEQTKAIRQDTRWIALLAAYREMLRGIDKLGNLGEVAQAAKAFIDLVPSIDANPSLMSDILSSLTIYQVACDGYPVRLSRYVRETLWESYPPEEAIDWSDCRE